MREITDEDRANALELKAKANKAFGAKDFTLSIDLYTQAIALNAKDATFWNNRAMSKTKLEEYGAAISDAAKAIQINPEYAKAYYRRGVSSLAIMRPKDAVPDFKKALELEPGNKAVREQLTATVKLVRRLEFEKVRGGNWLCVGHRVTRWLSVRLGSRGGRCPCITAAATSPASAITSSQLQLQKVSLTPGYCCWGDGVRIPALSDGHRTRGLCSGCEPKRTAPNHP